MDLVLSEDEMQWLSVLETSIAKAMVGFYEIGIALSSIQNNRLYRDRFKTFDEYCLQRWGIKSSHAYKLIKAANVVDVLKSNDDEFENDKVQLLDPQSQIVQKLPFWPQEITKSLPTSESQVRPLIKLPPNLQKKAWKKALNEAGDSRVTARDVSRAAASVAGIETEKSTARLKNRIEKDEMVSDEFKRCFMEFLTALQEARDEGWRSTSKAAALNHVYSLKTVIEV